MNDQVALDSIKSGSKTFAFASRFFGAEKARDAALLYHWLRACDDWIDEGGGATAAAKIRAEVGLALRGQPPEGPARAFAYVARKHAIPAHYAFEFVEGMLSDAEFRPPADLRELELYCYRVAGVVGLMMAHVMGISSEKALRNACDLGIAMQLTNISRDVMADHALGRCYLPIDLLTKHGLTIADYHRPENRARTALAVRELLDRADEYYASGEAGARFLSKRSSFVILIARFAYSRIGRKVRARGAHAWDERQFTTIYEKLGSLARASLLWLAQLPRRPSFFPTTISEVRRFA